ncbi:MAG TPA: hypothetical protein VEL28_00945 [Candidatus Binatia bacterium]|nr:hypothetical protein [Candidatus Binatia bacterium]
MNGQLDRHAPHTIEVGGADPSLVTYTHIIYALHALSVLIGITGPATVVGSFVFGLPSILAVIMNYVRRSEVAGTFLQSHFRWQIRTFWYALLWMLIASVISAPLILLFGLGLLTIALAAVVIGLWVVYRVLRGWLALRDARPIDF